MLKFRRVLYFKLLNMDFYDFLNIFDNEKLLINTISPNSYGISTKDVLFKKSLLSSDFLLLDGVYFALASIFLNGSNIIRNQGPDVFIKTMKFYNDKGGKVFFLGSTELVIEKIKENCKLFFPNISVEGFSPPFKDEFSINENSQILEMINLIKPDVVFIGMTCPKQEKWAYINFHNMNAKLIISIGNVFDWFAGTQKTIHPFWFKLRLGWLIRIFLRPEIFKRNIGNQMIFFKDLILFTLKLKKYD